MSEHFFRLEAITRISEFYAASDSQNGRKSSACQGEDSDTGSEGLETEAKLVDNPFSEQKAPTVRDNPIVQLIEQTLHL